MPKQMTNALAPTAEWLSAKSDFDSLVAARDGLIERIENIRLALSLARNTSDRARVPADLLLRAEPFEAQAASDPAGLQRRLAETEADLAKIAQRIGNGAHEAYERARRREGSRIALELQLQHRAAVGAMAAALEQLSQAIEAEREVHEAFAAVSPTASSAYLPNVGVELGVGSLGDCDSPAWRWRKRIHELGILGA